LSLREDLRKWVREHPVEAAFAGVVAATVLVYAYERLRWRWVRPRY